MTLGDVIRRYRYVNNLNMDEFAKKCDLSKSYVSMLENNKGPRGIPIKPSVETVYKVAKGMGMTVDAMLAYINQDVFVSTNPEIQYLFDDPTTEINLQIDAENPDPKKASHTNIKEIVKFFAKYRELLEAAEGCTDEQIQVATNVLKSYKKDDK